MVRLATLGAALAPLPLLTQAAKFPRAKQGNGFLSVPVGTVGRSGRSGSVGKRDEGEPIRTVLENMGYFYATERKWPCLFVCLRWLRGASAAPMAGWRVGSLQGVTGHSHCWDRRMANYLVHQSISGNPHRRSRF